MKPVWKRVGRGTLVSACAALIALLLVLLPITGVSASGSWSRQRDTQVQSDFKDVFFFPGDTEGWAVGGPQTASGGAFYDVWHTVDGGANWTPGLILNGPYIPLAQITMVEAVSFNNPSLGWACGLGGVISKYNGASWSVKRIGAGTELLTDIVSTSPTEVWAAGVNAAGTTSSWTPVVLKSDDAGETWKDITLNSTSFYDPSNGWAVGNSGAVLHSTDGGTTWSLQSSGTANNLKAVKAVSPDEAWIAGDQSTLLRTTDAGTTWSSDFGANAVCTRDATHSWVVGQYGLVMFYNGTKWTEEDPPTTANLTAVDFATDTYGWVVGDSGTAMYTLDGGGTWSSWPAAGNLKGVDVTNIAGDLYHVSVVGAAGYFAHTNHILSAPPPGPWAAASTPPPVENLTAIEYQSGANGYIAGANGTMVYTTNMGIDWTASTMTGGPANFTALSYTGVADEWFATAADGGIWQSRGNHMWAPMDINGVASPLVNTNYYVGNAGAIVKKVGAVFTVQDSGTTQNLRAVAAKNGNRLTAVGDNDTVVYTTDGGTTAWQPLPTGTAANWSAVSLVSDGGSDYTCVVGNGGVIRHAVGGVPGWRTPASVPAGAPDLKGVRFYNKDIGWAVGVNGTVWQTMDGSAATPHWSEVHLNDCFSLGSDDTYFVGDGGTIIHWMAASHTVELQFNATTWTTENLQSVYFRGPNHGYAVGDNGTVIEFDGTAGGWQAPIQVGTAVHPDLKGVHVLDPDDGYGYAVGSSGGNGYYVQLTDGTWSDAVEIGTTDHPPLNAVYLTAADAGYAVGESGFYVQLTGGTWGEPAQVGGANPNLNGLFVGGTDDVYAVGDGGYYAHQTGTGPPVWNVAQVGGANPDLYDIARPTGAGGYAVGGTGGVGYRVPVSAGTFVAPVSMGANSQELRGVSLYADNAGFACGLDRTVASVNVTTSGWAIDWTIATNAGDINALALVPGEQKGWAAGATGTVYALDGGLFKSQTLGTTEDLRAVSAPADNAVYATGNKGVLGKYNGTSWTTSAFADGNDMLAADFFNSSNGSIEGGGRTMWSTTNGGTSWSPDSGVNKTTYDLLSLDFVGNTDGWICGEHGLMYRYRGGAVVKQDPSGSGDSTNLRGVGMYGPGPNGGFLVGANRTIFGSTDGNTWSKLSQLSSPTTQTYYGLTAPGTYDAWFAGYNNLGSPTGVILGYRQGLINVSDTGNVSYPYMGINMVDNSGTYDGVAVGYNGIARYTADSGATWHDASGSIPTGNLNAVAGVGGHMVFCGDAGVVRRSTNYGQTWAAPTTAPVTTENLYGADMATDGINENAWVVGAKGLCFHSVNSGDTWAAQTSNTSNRLNSISARYDTGNFYLNAVGNLRAILRSTNAGTTWTVVSDVPGNALSHIGAASVNNVFFTGVGSTGGQVISTGNDGITFGKVVTGLPPMPQFNSIYVQDATHIWVAGGSDGTITPATPGVILYYNGIGWSVLVITTPSNLEIDDITVSGGVGVAVGQGGTVLMADDATQPGGAPTGWAALNTTKNPIRNDLKSAWFQWLAPGVGFCVAAGSHGTMGLNIDLTTKNWGFMMGPGNTLNGTTFMDASDGFACGNAGTVFRTNNGGTTWTPLNTQVSNDLLSITAVDNSHIWAVGKGGLILFSGDNGATWASQLSNTASDLYSIYAVNASDAWAVGAVDTGQAVIRHWDGATWNTLTDPPAVSSTLRSVTANGGHVWASGGDSGATLPNVVVCSDDDGTTWHDVSAGAFYAPLNSICVAAIGGTYQQDKVWTTGGQSILKWNGSGWDTESTPPISSTMMSVSFDRDRGGGPSDTMNGWVVGGYFGNGDGTILQTTNGGATWTTMTSNTGPMIGLNQVTTVWNGSNWDCFAVGDWGRIQKLNNAGVLPHIDTIDSPAVVGASINLTGTNFGAYDAGNDHVYFNDTVEGTVTGWNDTQIAVTVPTGAFGQNQDVHVVNAAGSSTGKPFTTTVTVDPIAGPITGGDSVTVTGTGFGSDPVNRNTTANHVAIGGVNVNDPGMTWAQNSITFTVPNDSPPGLTTAVLVQRANSGGSANTEVRPHVTGLSATSGRTGDLITVTGTNFGDDPTSSYDADNCLMEANMSGGGVVTLGEAPVGFIDTWNATHVQFNIPDGTGGFHPWTGQVAVRRGASQSSANPSITILPTVVDVSPPSGPTFTTVTVTGTAFGESANPGRHIYINNIEATVVNSWAWGQIVAVVPNNATSGAVKVTTSQGDSNIDRTFGVLPIASSLSTSSGRVGDSILIAGSGFGASKGSSSVTFNGVAAATTAWTVSSITATVPNAATTGNVVVNTTGGSTAGIAFTVMPKITSIDPPATGPGEIVTINGFTFGNTQGTSTVTFGGVQANSVTSWSANVIQVRVPVGAKSGNVIVTTPDGASNAFPFGVGPVVLSLDPTSGPPGALVTITGKDFKDTRGDATVKFNGVVATEYQAWSDTSIIVKIPLGATSGDVVVTTADGASNGKQFKVGPAHSYYFAEGTTRPNFQEWLSLMNPNADKANVHITYMMADGTTQGQDISVPQLTRATIYVPDVIGLNKDVSTRVDSDQPIVAERPMYFNYLPAYAPGQQWNGGHDVIGALAPGAEWYFAEGTTRSGFEEWICLQNPTTATAHVQILYMLGTGQTMTQGIDVGPTTRKTIDVRAAIGANVDCSAKVTSDVGIIAERPMYFNYMGDANDNWTGGHDVVGANRPWTDWYFAEGTTRLGFDEWVCLQNPGDTTATVKIQYSLATGQNPTQVVMVPAHSRQTVNVPGFLGRGQDVSMHISSDMAIVAERPMYFNYGPGQQNWNGGSDVIGANATAHDCEFAEGATWSGFQEYLSIQNPNSSDISVTITYMLGTGANKVQTVPVKAMSRVTVDVNAFVGSNQDVSASVTCNDPMMVERPMYFNYQGSGTHLNWTGGHDVIGLSF